MIARIRAANSVDAVCDILRAGGWATIADGIATKQPPATLREARGWAVADLLEEQGRFQ